MGEFVKQRYNCGRPAVLYFWRDNPGNEVDLLLETGTRLEPVVIKPGATFVPDWLTGLKKWASIAADETRPGWLVYGAADRYSREQIEVFPWRCLG